MPAYTFRCSDCGEAMDLVITHTEKGLLRAEGGPFCKKCEGPTKEVFGVPTIQFIGSGFYVNDYKK